MKSSRSPEAVLRHFNLFRDGVPTNAAVLLFGKEPRRFFNNIQVHCLHFAGTEKRKPILSQQPYEGRLFEVIDEAVEFVLGKLNRPVGTRAESSQASGDFEVPRSVIAEAIVNAVAHRDYRNPGFVQVIVFTDRIEVWNPGELPAGLTPELLRQPHGPLPRNPLIAEPLFRVKYVEKAGTGTTDMIADCLEAGLPEPHFEQCGPHFVTTVWRDWLTDAVLEGQELNERQMKAVSYLKSAKSMTNAEYREITGTSRPTAVRDLAELVEKGVFRREGSGRGTSYSIAAKRLKNDSNDSFMTQGDELGMGS